MKKETGIHIYELLIYATWQTTRWPKVDLAINSPPIYRGLESGSYFW